jgi:hypothetical protein
MEIAFLAFILATGLIVCMIVFIRKSVMNELKNTDKSSGDRAI